MKNLAYILVIVLLGVIAFFKYSNYKRFHPPVDYEYALNADIDMNYHDPMLVQQYLLNAYEAGNFARQQWYNHKIDVRFIKNKDARSAQAAGVYAQMITTTEFLEQKLLFSNELKSQGFDNDDVKYIEERGITAAQFTLEKQFDKVNLSTGDEGKHVEILQTMLNERGYELDIDGAFNSQTRNAIVQFQKDSDLMPTGVANEEVFKHLFQ